MLCKNEMIATNKRKYYRQNREKYIKRNSRWARENKEYMNDWKKQWKRRKNLKKEGAYLECYDT